MDDKGKNPKGLKRKPKGKGNPKPSKVHRAAKEKVSENKPSTGEKAPKSAQAIEGQKSRAKKNRQKQGTSANSKNKDRRKRFLERKNMNVAKPMEAVSEINEQPEPEIQSMEELSISVKT